MAERKTLLIPSLLDDWFPLLQYAFTSEEWEPVLLTEDDPHLAELGLKYFSRLGNPRLIRENTPCLHRNY